MKVGDLVRVVYEEGEKPTLPYDGVGIVVKLDKYNPRSEYAWITLHTGEDFRAFTLEVISESG